MPPFAQFLRDPPQTVSRFLLRALEGEEHGDADADPEPPIIKQQPEDEDKGDSDREC